MIRNIFSVLFCFFLLHTSCFSQGETAVPFLLITPYAEAAGMGEAAVSNHTDDPLSFMINPAHMGYLSQLNFHSYGYNFAHWLPGFGLSGIWIKTFAFSSGINLKKLKESYLPLSFGMGYSRIFLNLGEFNRRDEFNNDLGNFHAWESSDQITLGLGFRYWVGAYAGVAFKQIISHLGDRGSMEARAKALDYGLTIDVPVISIISGIGGKTVRISPLLTPYFDFKLGIANNNVSRDKVTYSLAVNSDPLPRYARAGIGIDFGINYALNNINLKLFSFKWTVEASDVMVKSHSGVFDSLTGTWTVRPYREYQEGLGNIKFFNEVFLGKTNKETEKRKGWELSIFEIFAFRSGRFLEDPERGARNFYTTGWGFRFSGLAVLLRSIYPALDELPVIGITLRHLDIQYNQSVLTTAERSHPLSGTKWDSINICIGS